MITMLLGGLWHGANWTFVLWGGIHGLGLCLERLGGKESAEPTGLALWARRVAIFAIVCLAWIFFRAKSLTEALRLITDVSLNAWAPELITAMVVVAVVAAICLSMDIRQNRYEEEYLFQSIPAPQRVAVAAGLLVILFLFSASESNAFLYFQF